MAPPRGRLVLLLPLVLLLQPTSTYGSFYVSQEDRDAANLAKRTQQEFCAGGVRGEIVDRTKARKELNEAMGGTNILLNSLRSARSPTEMLTLLRTQITPQWAVGRSWPIVLAIIAVILYAFCCWTAWPFKYCCRCCRCCSKTRNTWLPTKLTGAFLVLGLMVGVAVMTALSARGFKKVSDGFHNMACTGGTLLDTTLSGQPPESGAYFVGVLPTLSVFGTLDDNLNTGSPMLTDIQALLDQTKTISLAVTVASSTLQVLSDSMQSDANNAPGGGNLHHTCAICRPLAEQALQPAVDALNNGVAKALAAAREEVGRQLQSSTRDTLQQALRSSVRPLQQLKDGLRQMLSFFIDPQKFKQVQVYLEGQSSPVNGGQVGVIVAAWVLLGFGMAAMLSFVFCERCESRTKPGADPHCRSIHRIACCTWCCGFLYVIVVFILSGVMYIVATPLSATCLLMDELNGPLAVDVLPALGLEVNGDTADMFTSLIDECFTESAVQENNNILDLLYFRNSTGDKVTANQQIGVQFKERINDTFSILESKMDLPAASSNDGVQALRRILHDTPMDTLIIPDQNYDWSNDAQFRDLFAPDPWKGALAMMTSSACANLTLSADVPAIGGQTVPGIDNFISELSSVGTPTPDPTAYCGSGLVCGAGASATCTAAANFLNLKRQVAAASYRCDLFVDPVTGGVCDPKDMSQTASGEWVGDCVYADGTVRTLSQTCDLRGFVDYVRSFDARIQKVLERIDTDVDTTKDKIADELRRLTQVYVITPLDTVLGGMTCGFLAQFYRSTIDGLCFQSVFGIREVGVSWVVCALLITVLTMVMYALWRRAVDNVNSYQLPNAESPAEM